MREYAGGGGADPSYLVLATTIKDPASVCLCVCFFAIEILSYGKKIKDNDL